MRNIVCLTAAAYLISAGGFLARGQDRLIAASLRQKFVMTQITADRTDIVKEGTALTLRKGGLLMSSITDAIPCNNTYKNGKISQGLLSACKLVSVSTEGADTDRRVAQADEKMWIVAMNAEKNGFNFLLYSEPYNNVRYYAWLKISFEKHEVPTMEGVMSQFNEVLAIQAAGSPAETPVATETASQGATDTGPFLGLYANREETGQLQLNPDHTFSIKSTTGAADVGRFAVTTGTLVLYFKNDAGTIMAFNACGSNLCMHEEMVWTRQVVDTLQLPSTYVSSQSPEDKLQLNKDKSFSLQQAGQVYQGTFVMNGPNLEFSVNGSPDKIVTTLQGNSITDGNGLAWVRK